MFVEAGRLTVVDHLPLVLTRRGEELERGLQDPSAETEPVRTTDCSSSLSSTQSRVSPTAERTWPAVVDTVSVNVTLTPLEMGGGGGVEVEGPATKKATASNGGTEMVN